MKELLGHCDPASVSNGIFKDSFVTTATLHSQLKPNTLTWKRRVCGRPPISAMSEKDAFLTLCGDSLIIEPNYILFHYVHKCPGVGEREKRERDYILFASINSAQLQHVPSIFSNIRFLKSPSDIIWPFAVHNLASYQTSQINLCANVHTLTFMHTLPAVVCVLLDFTYK